MRDANDRQLELAGLLNEARHRRLQCGLRRSAIWRVAPFAAACRRLAYCELFSASIMSAQRCVIGVLAALGGVQMAASL